MQPSRFPLALATPKFEYSVPTSRLRRRCSISPDSIVALNLNANPALHAASSPNRKRPCDIEQNCFSESSDYDVALSLPLGPEDSPDNNHYHLPLAKRRLTANADVATSLLLSQPTSSHHAPAPQHVSAPHNIHPHRNHHSNNHTHHQHPHHPHHPLLLPSHVSGPVTSVSVPHLIQIPLRASSIGSPTRTPVSEYEDDDDVANGDNEDMTNQLPLPSPSASPSQDSNDKISPLSDWSNHSYLALPQTQEDLVGYITGLSSHLDRRAYNFLIFKLLQRVDRQTLSTFNGLIHALLPRDLLGDLPSEVAGRILRYLDYKTLLTLTRVCKKWNAIINNAHLWQDLLKRDKFIMSSAELKKELSPENAATLMAEWGGPHSFLCPSTAQILYKKRCMIYQRWMDPDYQPERITVMGHANKVVTCLQYDDDKIITGSEGRLISIYCTRTGKLLRVLEGHEGGVWAMKYIGNTLVTGSTDRTVRIWNIATGRCTHILRGHTSTVRCLDIMPPAVIGKDSSGQEIVYPKETLLVTGSRDHSLHVWRLPLCDDDPDAMDINTPTYDSGDYPTNPYLVSVLTGHIQLVRSVTGHGNIIISGSYDSTVRVWDLMDNGDCKHVLSGHHDKVYSMVMDYDSKVCYSASMDQTVIIWAFETGTILHTLEGHTSLVGLLDLADGVLVLAAADFSIRVWDPKTGEHYNKLEGHGGPITCFEHDGLRVVSGSDRMLKLWDIKTGQFCRNLLTDVTGGIWQVRIDYRRCVAAVQRYINEEEYDTFIEILDFSKPMSQHTPSQLT